MRAILPAALGGQQSDMAMLRHSYRDEIARQVQPLHQHSYTCGS
jgi:hypothetical protein